jgi:hypothetical protein
VCCYAGDVVLESAASAAVFSGGYNTIETRCSHLRLEQMEITGGSSRCHYHHAAEAVVENTPVHHCPRHGRNRR